MATRMGEYRAIPHGSSGRTGPAWSPGSKTAIRGPWRSCIACSRAESASISAGSLGPQELDDKVHDTFLIVVQAICRGELRDPDRLMGFVRTVVRRQVAAHIDKAVQARREQADLQCGSIVSDGRNNPEQDAISRQRQEIMTAVLRSLSRRDREILTRFYLRGESQEQICGEMGLTETQFRLLKSRAKARFGELGRRKLQKRVLPSLLPRAVSA